MLKFNSTQLLGLPTLVKHAHQIVINIYFSNIIILTTFLQKFYDIYTP